jgi:hypothetical protein
LLAVSYTIPIGHDGWALSPAGLPGIPPGVGRDSSSQEIVPIQGPDLTNITSQPVVVAREINTGLTGSFSPTTNANGIPGPFYEPECHTCTIPKRV